MAGGGWEHTLLSRGVALMNVLEGVPGAVPPPYNPNLAWGPLGAKQGSPNHEAEAWSIEAVRAAMDREPGREPTLSRAVLLSAYFPRELAEGPDGIGLWASEQMCPDSHGGQHLVGTTFARIAAVLSGDAALLERSGRLLRTTAQALLCVASPDLQVWSAGMRPVPVKAKGPNGERLYRAPFSGVASEWLRELLGTEHGRALSPELAKTESQKNKVARNWRTPQYLAVRGLRWLLGSDKGVPRDRALYSWAFGGVRSAAVPRDSPFLTSAPRMDPCPLKYKMTVWRSRTGHLSVIDKPPSRPGAKPVTAVCDWLWVPYPASEKTVRCGFDFQAPPPTPPRGAKMLIFPGRS